MLSGASREARNEFDLWRRALRRAPVAEDAPVPPDVSAAQTVFICAQESVQVFLERLPHFSLHRAALVQHAIRVQVAHEEPGLAMNANKWAKERELAGL